jgi:eukaryotic-like serine/threonine-protein kinase
MTLWSSRSSWRRRPAALTKASDPGVLPPAIGRYEILRELGRGAMGVVYEAFDPALGRTIALKTILPAVSVVPKEREAYEGRFFTEGRIAARLSHPGIVVVHDLGRDAATGVLYIALEYLRGRTLAEVTRGRRGLPWREAFRIASFVARALAHAHTHGVVHRDLKPANVMILPSGEPKIMDFGIAKIDTSVRLTSPGETLGTPLYMSPEQAMGEAVTVRSDIFSLGSIVYTLLTGHPAFAAEGVPKILGRVVRDDPVPASSLVSGVPSSVDRVLERAMAKSPDERYPSALLFAEDLEDVLEGHFPRHLLTDVDAAALDAIPVSGSATAPSSLPRTDVELVVAEDDPLESALRLLADEPGGPPRPATLALKKEPGPPPKRARLRTAVTVALAILVLGLGYVFTRGRGMRAAPDGASLPPASLPSPAGPSGSAAPIPSPLAPSGLTGSLRTPWEDPAHLAIDFEHPLKTGRLRLWVDEDMVLDEKLSSRTAKKALGLSFSQGSLTQTVDVRPGRHTIRAQVTWEEDDKTESIAGTFKPGVTRRLEVRLGRLRKNLSLDWQ